MSGKMIHPFFDFPEVLSEFLNFECYSGADHFILKKQ